MFPADDFIQLYVSHGAWEKRTGRNSRRQIKKEAAKLVSILMKASWGVELAGSFTTEEVMSATPGGEHAK